MPNETDLGSAALSSGYEGPTDAGGSVYPEGTNNVEKAEEQAHAEDAARQHITEYHNEKIRYGEDDWGVETDGGPIHSRSLHNLAKPAGDTAGDDYELRKLGEKLGKSEQEIRERMAKDTRAALDYGRAILENKLEFGEKLGLGEEAFKVIADFAKEHTELTSGRLLGTDDGERIFLYPVPIEADVAGEGNKIIFSSLRFGRSGRGLDDKSEVWDVGPGFRAGSYESKERSYEGSPEEQTTVETTRSRSIQKDDLEQIKNLLERVRS